MDPALTKTLIGAVATVAVAAVTAGFQYSAKLREERRLLRIAIVEADAKVAATFGELIGRSHGRGRSELSDELIRVLLADGVLLDTIRQVYSDRIRNAPDSSAMVRQVLGELPIAHPIGTDDMDATLRVLAALGDKHEELTSAARGAVEGRASWKPLTDGPDLVLALKKREKWNRRSRLGKIRHFRERP
ncbi:hypothetical protein [Streptomyces sp. NPDC020917]|uniref:hypothetical protein n=1 Tax=Streptomyces sp. NPDC020917 TaxID=3365102 RepID=UPI0037ABEA1C